MTHIWASELSHRRFRKLFVTYSAPIYYLCHGWFIGFWNANKKCEWKLSPNTKCYFKDKHLDISSTKWRLFCVLFQSWLWLLGHNDEWRKTADQIYSGELWASRASGTPCLELKWSHRSGRGSEPGSRQWGWHSEADNGQSGMAYYGEC